MSAQAQLVWKRNGTQSKVGVSKLYFPQNGTNNEYSAGTGTSYVKSFDISGIDYISTSSWLSANPSLSDYVAPSYPDYYRSVSGWDQHLNWNLENVHDPSVVKASDGYYYMYQTDASFGNAHVASGGHFMSRRSKDLVNWEYVGTTMSTVPAWIKDTLNNIRSRAGLSATTINFNESNEWNFGYWAPCVRKVNDNLYRMYYSIVMPDGAMTTGTNVGERAFIGMMESCNPADSASWVDKGYVVTQYSDQDLNWTGKSQWGGYYKWNAIDPSYIITSSGEHWLIYGSWHSGIVAMQLNPDTGKSLVKQGNPWGSVNAAGYGKRVFTRTSGSRWQASEGPEVVFHDGYYYMFLAYDELAVNYNTRVVRSKNIDGPYYNYMGKEVTDGADAWPIVTHPYIFNDNNSVGWVGISHCAVWDDGDGNWYFASQGRLPADSYDDAYSNAIMMGQVRRIIWTENGWPVVLPERYGNVPQEVITEDEIIGGWEGVTLAYNKGKQDPSVVMTLKNDNTVSGNLFNGKQWSFDTQKNILSIGSGSSAINLYVARECDWEASPRKATIVFAGLTPESSTVPTTYWGKKVDDALARYSTYGAEDNTTAFNTVTTPELTSSSANCKFHWNFTNYNTGKGSNWENWCLSVNDGNSKELVFIRSDNFAWANGTFATNTSVAGWFNSISADYNWDTFVSDMNGANVDLTVTVKDGMLSMTAVTTTIGGSTYTYNFSMPIAVGVKGAHLTMEKSHLVLDNENSGVTEL